MSRALFSHRANKVARGTLLAVVAIAIGVPVALMVYARTSFATGEHAVVTQPIPFDHRIHAYDLKIDCRFCHSTAERSANAGLPPTVACIGCHSKVWRESQQFAPVRASSDSGRPIAWRRVNALPGFVYFDHSVHLAKGVGCASCHGRVDQMARVEQAAPLTMQWCVDCHRDPGTNLRPKTLIANMEWKPPTDPERAAALRTELEGEYHTRRLTNCSTCHR